MRAAALHAPAWAEGCQHAIETPPCKCKPTIIAPPQAEYSALVRLHAPFHPTSACDEFEGACHHKTAASRSGGCMCVC